MAGSDLIGRGGIRRLEEWIEQVNFCASQGHPYMQRVMAYSPEGRVKVECTGCQDLREREATPEEREEYQKLMKPMVIA